MAENDRPLPNPPRQRFGGGPFAQGDAPGETTADRMALAAAEGRLEEFLQRELPEGEHARELARMMLGMTGMLPPGMSAPSTGAASGAASQPAQTPQGAQAAQTARAAGVAAPETPVAGAVSPEVVAAVAQGDVGGLASLLRAEHERRAGGAPVPDAAPAPARCLAEGPAGQPGPQAARPGIDASLVEELVRIGADNDVSVDWLFLRAVRLYVEEYRRTGRL